MRLHRSTAAFVAAAMLAIVTIASAAKLDPPTLTVLETSRTSITIQVQAGTTGAPGGFNIQWMKRADYDRLGWVAPGATGSTNVVFYGFPTYNRMDGTNSYQLAPSSTQIAEPGLPRAAGGVVQSPALRAIRSGRGVDQNAQHSHAIRSRRAGITVVYSTCARLLVTR